MENQGEKKVHNDTLMPNTVYGGSK
ncbi:uncharacterized protein G2W53_027873 [Senna tora]|uniref:Uncharacterized protein n=1 Tax=Senna tora TaxID=362788 RepID=A0A834THQ6_9FABA|nr:uncharacterized protein G2W53_027873 [Senna tora]